MKSMIDTSVPAPVQIKPIDYASYGDSVAKNIREGANQVGSIITAAKTVNDEMDKEELKRGMLTQLQAEAPHVLKYAKPNMKFEEVAKAAYQMDVVRGLWQKAAAATPKNAEGLPDRTLASMENFDQLAFAANEQQFQKIIEGLNAYIKEGDQSKIDRDIMSGVSEAAKTGGTKEENISAFLQNPNAQKLSPKEGVPLLKESGVAGSVLANNATKERVAQATSATKMAIAEAKAKADKLKADALDRHRARMAGLRSKTTGLLEVQVANLVQKTIDDQTTDRIQAIKSEKSAEDAIAKLQKTAGEYKKLMASYKSMSEMEDMDNETKAAARTKYAAALDNYNNAVESIQAQQEIVETSKSTRSEIEKNQKEFKQAVLETHPSMDKAFSTWKEDVETEIKTDSTEKPGKDTPESNAKKLYNQKFGTPANPDPFSQQTPQKQQEIIRRLK